MKTTLGIGINYSDTFRNESILQVINSLELLEKISDDVFERINKTVNINKLI